MGRHGSGTPKAAARPWPLIAAITVLVVVAGALGWWWWSLRSVEDPVDAAPVAGYATVRSSATCPDAGVVVELEPPAPAVTAEIDGCGQRVGRQVAIEYLASDPTQVRPAGTTTAAPPGAERWLPLGILAAGVLAVGATLFLLIERRIHRHDTAAPVTVAELRRRAGPAGPSPTAARLGPAHQAGAAGAGVAGAVAVVPGAGTSSADPDPTDDGGPAVVAEPGPGPIDEEQPLFGEDTAASAPAAPWLPVETGAGNGSATSTSSSVDPSSSVGTPGTEPPAAPPTEPSAGSPTESSSESRTDSAEDGTVTEDPGPWRDTTAADRDGFDDTDQLFLRPERTGPDLSGTTGDLFTHRDPSGPGWA